MKLLIVFPLAALLLAAADAPVTRVDPPPTPVKLLEIPKGASETVPGTYRFTDKEGKNWIYRKTPFGVVRFEDKAAAETGTPAQEPMLDVKATADGDTIRFERPTPFGVHKWQRKKSELNEMERQVWEREEARRNAHQD